MVGAQADMTSKWLARMTLREKIGQMTMAERMWASPEDVRAHGLGAILSGGGSHPGDNEPADWVAMNDAYWQACMAGEGASGIPILFAVDAVHGHNNVKGATIFPHNIGFGAADNTELVEAMARVTAREILASGLEWNFAPTLAVAQDCQWGRTYESYGNDPERAARFGEVYVRALQDEGVMACVKHWVGDGGTSHGMDQGDTRMPWPELERTHVSPYYPALEAGVLSVMVSFNSWNGLKCHGHHHLVTEVLKEKLGFGGIVVSDWDGVKYLDSDYATAVAASVNAGLDMFMVPEHWRDFIDALEGQVQRGVVAVERIDDAVGRILRTKERFGLFAGIAPSARAAPHASSFGSEAHRAVAREAVRQSLVLLKNDRDVLPLDPNARVLVAGRSAHNLGHQCGGWTLSWQGEPGNDGVVGTSIWQAIAQVAPSAELSIDGSAADRAAHDVAVVVIGERPYAEGFGDIRSGDDRVIQAGSMIQGLMNPLEPYGGSLALSDLHPEDAECIERIRDSGVPVVALLVSGRPLIVGREWDASDAFVAAWLPGSEGTGVADVLFGKAPFSGKLPLPWPAEVVDTESGSEITERFPAGYGLTTDGAPSEPVDNVVLVDYKADLVDDNVVISGVAIVGDRSESEKLGDRGTCQGGRG